MTLSKMTLDKMTLNEKLSIASNIEVQEFTSKYSHILLVFDRIFSTARASTAKAMFGTTPPDTEVNGKQNAPAAPGTLQEDRSEEGGRLADERQGKTQGRLGKSTQV